MSIKLTYYLGKNKIDLKRFCQKMNIESYDCLFSYCTNKNIKCDMTQEDYNSFFPKEKKIKNEEKIIEKPKTSAKTRRRGRKSKVKSTGNIDSKNNPWGLL